MASLGIQFEYNTVYIHDLERKIYIKNQLKVPTHFTVMGKLCTNPQLYHYYMILHHPSLIKKGEEQILFSEVLTGMTLKQKVHLTGHIKTIRPGNNQLHSTNSST